MALYNERELAAGLRKKLTGTGQDVSSAIISGLLLFIAIMAALNLGGWLAIGMWFTVALNIIALLCRMSGWKVVVLRNEEQTWLRKHYTL